MNKKILIGSIIAVVIIILPSSMVKGKDEIRTENNIYVNNLKIKPIPYYIVLIIGEISNLTRSGGWTPCYHFNIEKGLTFSTFIPFFRIRYNCNARVVIPSFNGFINDNFIFGITGAINIYH